MTFGKYGVSRQSIEDFPGERIKNRDFLYLVVKQCDAHGLFFRFCRKDINHVATHPVSATLKGHIVALWVCCLFFLLAL